MQTYIDNMCTYYMQVKHANNTHYKISHAIMSMNIIIVYMKFTLNYSTHR